METLESLEQHELYENARKRVRAKRKVYFHFMLFLVGSILLIITNKILHIGEDFTFLGISFTNWFIPVVLLWFFFFLSHAIKVFIFQRLMGKEWERKQTEKLVLKQEKRIAKLEKKIAKEYQKEAKEIIENNDKEVEDKVVTTTDETKSESI
ncbi:MAG: 2TM domain-containing protein [Flavobacteriaceae bacterium]|nr:2TM domain-containing protein [Flavobacteriaceae bacterium]